MAVELIHFNGFNGIFVSFPTQFHHNRLLYMLSKRIIDLHGLQKSSYSIRLNSIHRILILNYKHTKKQQTEILLLQYNLSKVETLISGKHPLSGILFLPSKFLYKMTSISGKFTSKQWK